MDSVLRAEILRRYEAHAQRFEQHAESRRRRGLVVLDDEPQPESMAPARPVGRITGTELRILELVAQGLTDKQIAEHEGLSEFTVKSHVRSLFRKLPAKNRPHAVATAVRNGVLPLERLAATA